MNEYFAILKRLQEAQRTAVSKEKERIKNVTVQDHMLSNQSPPEQGKVDSYSNQRNSFQIL